MASMTQSPVSFNGKLALKPTASDLLRSSTNSVCGIPLKPLGRAQLGAKRRDFSIMAKFRKPKKHEYPWPKDPDPNVKGGILTHLSPFKPLKEMPKPVMLDFEKPLLDLQEKIVNVQRMSNETGLDFSDQITSLENKYQQTLKSLYKRLTPIQRVAIARHPHRPTFLDHVFNITEKFVELHGDRAGYDDPAIVTGLGTINGRTYMFIGHQKGRNTKENIRRNFGMPTPHGYRKALRMMYYADHHGFPIITFIDTPGAYADLKSEELGQGEAIAHNLRSMFGLKVPVVSIVMGEGGSGGALAIGCANKLLMLENAVFYVASPEACAAILWKSAKASPKAAKKLRITAKELTKLQIADFVIPEPLGGAHADPEWTSQQIKAAIVNFMDQLMKMDTETLLKQRAEKFRKLGGFKDDIPVDPERKVNMKEQETILTGKALELKLREKFKKMKVLILEARKSSGNRPVTAFKEIIKRLEREIDYEYEEAAKFLGIKDRISTVRKEIAKARNLNDQLENPALREQIRQLADEFHKNLPSAPNYLSLKYKLAMLKELSKASNVSKKSSSKALNLSKKRSSKASKLSKKSSSEASNLSKKRSNEDDLKLEISKRFSEVMDRPDVKQKVEALKAEIANSGVSDIDSEPELKEKVSQLRGEIASEFKAVLNSLGLQAVPSNYEALTKMKAFNEEVTMHIDDVANSSDLKEKIELLKAEVEKAGNTPDEESKSKIQALEAEIKQAIIEAVISSPELKERHESVAAEVLEGTKSTVGSDGSLGEENTEESQVEVNLEANHSII